MYWQISVTIMSFGDQGGGERNGSQNSCTVVMTHNDLCICIALTKWDGPVACVNVTENVENFQSKGYHFTATKTSVTVSVKQYEHDRVIGCIFSVDFKEINTISQSLPSTSVIYNRGRAAVTEERLERIGYREPWIFEYEFRYIFSQDVWHTRQTLTKWRIKCPMLTQDGMLNMFSWYKPRLNFTAVGL